jgi:hypothetical protein
MTENQRYITAGVISVTIIAAMFIMPHLNNGIGRPDNSDNPDTLYVLWEPGKSHIYKWDKLGEYLYKQPWNPKGFVVFYSMYGHDSHGYSTSEDTFEGHYKVSEKFQSEAKNFVSADFYRWKTWTSQEPGTFGTFIKCVEDHNFNQSKVCDCSFLMPD